MILENLSANKEGSKFLRLNDSFCTYVASCLTKEKVTNVIGLTIYGFFRNFYAVKPWIILSVGFIFIFGLVFYMFPLVTLNAAMLNSIFSFSGNPTNSNEMHFIYNAISALEAFLGIFFVLVVSFIFTRKYSNYL